MSPVNRERMNMDNRPPTYGTGAGKAPYPALVHLSGRLRGTTQLLLGNPLSITAAANRQVTVVAGATGEASLLAVLERRGASYELQADPGVEIWVNGEQVDNLVLASGDVIEIGKSGAVLRFRLYPPQIEDLTRPWPRHSRIASTVRATAAVAPSIVRGSFWPDYHTSSLPKPHR